MYWDMKHGQEHAAWTRNCSAWTWTCRIDKYMSSSCSCCMFVFMLHAACHASVHAACPCCMPMFMLHVWAHPAFYVHAACCNTYSVSMSIVHANVYAACPCPCCISMSVLHDHFHAVYPCPCCMSMSMLHIQVSSMDMGLHHEQVHAAWTSTCCMDKYMLLGQVHAAWTSTCFMSMSMLYVHVRAACPCPCCAFISVLHGLKYAALTWTCKMDMNKQNDGQGHAAWIWTCSINIGMQHGHGHTGCIATCSMDIKCRKGTDMQHEHGYAAWRNTCCMSSSCPSCLSILILHAACPYPCSKTLDRRPCTGRSQEAVVIFLFGLEALLTRDSRVLSCAVSSSPQTIGCYWLLQWSNPVSIGSHSDQTSFQSSSLYLWALGKHCFVKMSSSTLCCTVFSYNVFDPCCMLISMLPIYVHAACGSTCCVSMSMQHGQVHAVCPYPCCLDSNTLHISAHAACPCMSLFMRYIYSMLHVQLSISLLLGLKYA